MGYYHHVLQFLTFLGDSGEVRQVKIGKLKLQYSEKNKTITKITRTEQIPEFCNKIRYLLK